MASDTVGMHTKIGCRMATPPPSSWPADLITNTTHHTGRWGLQDGRSIQSEEASQDIYTFVYTLRILLLMSRICGLKLNSRLRCNVDAGVLVKQHLFRT